MNKTLENRDIEQDALIEYLKPKKLIISDADKLLECPCAKNNIKPKTPNGKYIKLSEPKVNYDELTCSYKMINKVHTQICNMVEKNIIDNVIAYAKENDVVDLILIDEQFVRNALKHEEQRQQKTKRTNYDKIISSEDALAEFLELTMDCSKCVVFKDKYDCYVTKQMTCKECIKEWLQRESE